MHIPYELQGKMCQGVELGQYLIDKLCNTLCAMERISGTSNFNKKIISKKLLKEITFKCT